MSKSYFGMGLTAFGLVPHRSEDSMGAGMAWSWLNPNLFDRSSELMFQGYYQAHLFAVLTARRELHSHAGSERRSRRRLGADFPAHRPLLSGFRALKHRGRDGAYGRCSCY